MIKDSTNFLVYSRRGRAALAFRYRAMRLARLPRSQPAPPGAARSRAPARRRHAAGLLPDPGHAVRGARTHAAHERAGQPNLVVAQPPVTRYRPARGKGLGR